MFSSFNTSNTKSSSSYDCRWNNRKDSYAATAFATTLLPSSTSPSSDSIVPKHHQCESIDRHASNLTNRWFYVKDEKRRTEKKKKTSYIRWSVQIAEKLWIIEDRENDKKIDVRKKREGENRLISCLWSDEREEEKNTHSLAHLLTRICAYINFVRLTYELCEWIKFLVDFKTKSMSNTSDHHHHQGIWLIIETNSSTFFSLVFTNDFTRNSSNEKHLRILIFAESFPSFTSGITRRFKEIIRRLATYEHDIHVITGCKVRRIERTNRKELSNLERSSMGRRQRTFRKTRDIFDSSIDWIYE